MSQSKKRLRVTTHSPVQALGAPCPAPRAIYGAPIRGTIMSLRQPRCSVRRAVGHVVYGLHSRIPLCCVLAWVLPLATIGYRARPAKAWLIRNERAVPFADSIRLRFGVAYRPCPVCDWLINHGVRRPARIHICADSCRPRSLA